MNSEMGPIVQIVDSTNNVSDDEIDKAIDKEINLDEN